MKSGSGEKLSATFSKGSRSLWMSERLWVMREAMRSIVLRKKNDQVGCSGKQQETEEREKLRAWGDGKRRGGKKI